MLSSKTKKEIIKHGLTPSGFINRERVLTYAVNKLIVVLPHSERPLVKKRLIKFINDPRTKAFPLSQYIDVLSTAINICLDVGSGGSIIVTKLVFELGIRIILRIGQRWPQIHKKIREFREKKTSLASIEELSIYIARQILRFTTLTPPQIIAFAQFITVMVREDKKFDQRTA